MLSPILLTNNPRFQDLSLTGMDIMFIPECPPLSFARRAT